MRSAPAIAGLLLVACATTSTQTKSMEEHGVKVSSEALRVRLRSEAIPFTGLMEQAADATSAASEDPGVRRQALVWKINVVPALYRTLFNQRPLVALLDTWALLLQAEGYLRSPQGKASMGPGAETVLVTTLDLEARVRDIAAWAAPGRDLGKMRARLQTWADEHPVTLTFATRDGVESYMATIAPAEELGIMDIAGRMNEDLDGLIARMDFLPVMVPRQATWQAELAYVDLMDPRLELALSRAGQGLDRVDDMLAWLGTKGLDAFAAQQRIQLEKAVTLQRIEVERLIDRQRTEVQAFVDGERAQIQAIVQRERAAIMADAQRLADHAAAEGARRAREVVDHAVARLAMLLGAALVAGLAIVWVARRRGQPPRA